MYLPNPSDYSKESNFFWGIVGRVAGRIKNGVWTHGNIINHFPKNDGENSLHGGESIDERVWAFQPMIEKDKVRITLTIFDPDGTNGYPGNLLIHVTYSLDNKNNLRCQINAECDQTTLFNPTNHTYFRLDGPDSKIDDLELKLNADYYVPVDDNTMPTCQMKPAAGTLWDFKKSRKLGEVIHSQEHEITIRNGLDHPFILNGRSPAAILLSPTKHRRMIMTTDAQSLVIFTANTFNHKGVSRNLGEHDGITLEAQFSPQYGDDLTPFVLIPGHEFSRYMNWQFEY